MCNRLDRDAVPAELTDYFDNPQSWWKSNPNRKERTLLSEPLSWSQEPMKKAQSQSSSSQYPISKQPPKWTINRNQRDQTRDVPWTKCTSEKRTKEVDGECRGQVEFFWKVKVVECFSLFGKRVKRSSQKGSSQTRFSRIANEPQRHLKLYQCVRTF
jgi:hypothetical protein